MNVLYTIGRLNVGGAEMRSLRLFQALKNDGYKCKVIVYVISGKPGTLDNEFKKNGVKIIYGKPGVFGLFNFYSVLLNENIDILHTNVSTANGFYALASRIAGVKKIISHYRSIEDVREGKFHKVKAAIGRFLTNSLSSHVVGVCASAQSFSRAPDRKWKTIYNGLDLPKLGRGAVANTGEFVIGYLGRISPEKNPYRALDIFQRLKDRNNSSKTMRMIFAGGGESGYLDNFLLEIKKRKLDADVNYSGVTDKPIEFLKKCDVLLLPSVREGLPGSVLEAISVGTPVVATSLPGVLEIKAQVGGCEVLPLSASDDEWCDAILRANNYDREDVMSRFRCGPFLIDKHVSCIVDLWGIQK